MQSVKKIRKFIVDLENHANLWLKLMDVIQMLILMDLED
jgi:hypothetical protein